MLHYCNRLLSDNKIQVSGVVLRSFQQENELALGCNIFLIQIDYEETMVFEVCFKARRFCRIFDSALLAVIVRLAAEEAGKTWLDKLQCMSLGSMTKSDDHTDSTILTTH